MIFASVQHLDSYKKNQFYTADKPTLMLMLYQGAIDFLNRAKVHLRKGQIAEKGIYISKAHAIIAELLASLDFSSGGELPRSLEALYRFMMDHLMRAHTSNDAEAIDDVLAMLRTLQEGWQLAVAQTRAESTARHE